MLASGWFILYNLESLQSQMCYNGIAHITDCGRALMFFRGRVVCASHVWGVSIFTVRDTELKMFTRFNLDTHQCEKADGVVINISEAKGRGRTAYYV